MIERLKSIPPPGLPQKIKVDLQHTFCTSTASVGDPHLVPVPADASGGCFHLMRTISRSGPTPRRGPQGLFPMTFEFETNAVAQSIFCLVAQYPVAKKPSIHSFNRFLLSPRILVTRDLGSLVGSPPSSDRRTAGHDQGLCPRPKQSKTFWASSSPQRTEQGSFERRRLLRL